MFLIYWSVVALLCVLIIDNSFLALKDYKQNKNVIRLILRFGMLFILLLVIINSTARLLNMSIDISILP